MMFISRGNFVKENNILNYILFHIVSDVSNDFQVASKSEGEAKDKDDTLCDILASAAFDKYPSDFESKFL